MAGKKNQRHTMMIAGKKVRYGDKDYRRQQRKDNRRLKYGPLIHAITHPIKHFGKHF